MTSLKKAKFESLNIVLHEIWATSQDCAPTKIQLGYTYDSGHKANAIVIIDCAPAILNTIRQVIDEQKLALMISAGHGGVVVS